jgi:hypothetical protein
LNCPPGVSQRVSFVLPCPSVIWQIVQVMRKHPNVFYLLDDHGKPVPEPDIPRWGEWFERPENRMLWHDDLPNDVSVSTVFLGIDHNPRDRGPPILWETMIFGGPHDQYQKRYTSSADAFKGHGETVALAKRKA